LVAAFQIPVGLAVSDEDQFRHGERPQASRCS
jgi:hypothetical protein